MIAGGGGVQVGRLEWTRRGQPLGDGPGALQLHPAALHFWRHYTPVTRTPGTSRHDPRWHTRVAGPPTSGHGVGVGGLSTPGGGVSRAPKNWGGGGGWEKGSIDRTIDQ